MPATRSTAGITARRSSSGIAIITSTSSRAPGRPTASRCSVRWRPSWPKRPRNGSKKPATDCIRFARAIIARWPRRTIGYAHPATKEKSPYDDFPDHLLTLHDRDTIAMFLSKLAEQDQTLRLSSFVVAACREFGWNAFARELKQLISSRPNTAWPTRKSRSATSNGSPPSVATRRRTRTSRRLPTNCVRWRWNDSANRVRHDRRTTRPYYRRETFRFRIVAAAVAQGAGGNRSRRRPVACDSLRPGIAGRIQPGRLPGSLL